VAVFEGKGRKTGENAGFWTKRGRFGQTGKRVGFAGEEWSAGNGLLTARR
jgi:hypothetical protein